MIFFMIYCLYSSRTTSFHAKINKKIKQGKSKQTRKIYLIGGFSGISGFLGGTWSYMCSPKTIANKVLWTLQRFVLCTHLVKVVFYEQLSQNVFTRGKLWSELCGSSGLWFRDLPQSTFLHIFFPVDLLGRAICYGISFFRCYCLKTHLQNLKGSSISYYL